MLNPRDKPDGSPCIGICSHATGDLVCRGCGRTIAEVRDWNTYTSEQKILIRERLKMGPSIKRAISNVKPHFWYEHNKWKVRHGAWVFCGMSLDQCNKNYLYWSMQSNEKPSAP